MPGAARTDQNRLALEPAFLAVTCERVKQALYADLGVTTLSRGIVNITIRSIRGTYRELAYTTERFGNNWIYRLDLPPQVERHQLLRVLVQVLLQEMAQLARGGNHSAASQPKLWRPDARPDRPPGPPTRSAGGRAPRVA